MLGTETACSRWRRTMSDHRLPSGPTALEDVPTTQLVREALEEARELVRVEVEIAKNEVHSEMQRGKRAAVAFGLAAAFVILGLNALVIAAVLALGGAPYVAVV